MTMQDSLNFMLGQYVSVGINSPKKYPDKALLSTESARSNAFRSDDELDAYIRAMAQQQKGKDGSKN